MSSLFSNTRNVASPFILLQCIMLKHQSGKCLLEPQRSGLMRAGPGFSLLCSRSVRPAEMLTPYIFDVQSSTDTTQQALGLKHWPVCFSSETRKRKPRRERERPKGQRTVVSSSTIIPYGTRDSLKRQTHTHTHIPQSLITSVCLR